MNGFQVVFAPFKMETLREVVLTEHPEIVPATLFEFRVLDRREVSDFTTGQSKSDIPASDCSLLLVIRLRRIRRTFQPDSRKPCRIFDQIDGLSAVVRNAVAPTVTMATQLPVKQDRPDRSGIDQTDKFRRSEFR